ncbi:MAG: ribonuclease H-like domain-containing protein [bacterium]|nr:ribonuclease H-like domain-containing protein [bacterium]
MATLIVDIETVGEDWEQIDPETQKLLVNRVKKQPNYSEETDPTTIAQESLGLQPFTGRIVVIGAYDLASKKSVVWFDNEGESTDAVEEGDDKFIPAGEKEMLEKYWALATRYTHFVTYSGRSLDMPFLLLRSAIHDIKPTKDLMRARYLYQQSPDAIHIDLYEQLSFYGAVNKLGGLHLACRAFGVETPKNGEIDGSKVGQFFRNKKYMEIARYNARDLSSTAELYEKWKQFLTF